jgi:GT2 family glycosyltransferase
MHWFLKTFIVPLLDALRPAVIVEVGVELGTVTKPLLEWSRANGGAVVHSIDPSPKLEVDALLAEYGELLRFHRIRSLEVLSEIEGVDLALIDGDHNWYTVINELRELERRARSDGRPPPVILLHDIGWPYGRRDLYYDPQSIPAAHRQPHARSGIVPGRAELAPGGVNAHLENAKLEGTPANGVLTAAEDFVAESRESWRLFSIPGLSGLGVLVATATLAEREPVRQLLDSVDDPAFLRAQCEAIEQARLQAEVRRAGLTRKLAKAELELRAVDPEELPELEDRAASLGVQLRVVAELEERLGDALAESAGRVLRADRLAGTKETQTEETQTPQTGEGETEPQSAHGHGIGADGVEGEDKRRQPELDGSLSVALRYRLGLASAARERLEAELDHTRASLRDELEQTRAQLADALGAREQLTHELSELRVETQLLDAQNDRLQATLGRAGGDAQLAQAERDALRRRLDELTANGVPDEGLDEQKRSRSEHDLTAVWRERDELIRALASWRACPWWERELEQQGRQAFLESYLPLLESASESADVRDPLALPIPADYEGLLAGAEQEPGAPSVDVVVCVHDALEDVRRCLSSLLAFSARRFRLILIDDGSAAPTRTWLCDFAASHSAVTLIEREPPHGYTLAANAGLRASRSDYVVLLNSDTIVSPGWLGKLVAHGERNPRVGILGPISNAASHQSVPALREDGAWATNPLPGWLTVDGMALIVERAPRAEARLPFINGFCYVVKREVIDSIGYLDEERFAEGYCEENDFSHRAFRRGFALAVADDVYVYHAKSRSFGAEGRNELARRHYRTFLEKHDSGEIERLVSEMEADQTLGPLREAVAGASASPATLAPLLSADGRAPLEVAFLLPGLSEGGSGGSHSIYQEVLGMRELGISARIVVPHTTWERVRSTYEDAEDVFEVFSGEDDLAARTSTADVISATHFKSVALLGRLRELREDFLAAYYVQDYEPFFVSAGETDLEEALASYTALEDMVLFAKTHWLCNVVGARHGVRVHKVEPSIDERLFRPAAGGEEERDRGPVRILAMVRPRTPRRQPFSTIALLEGLLKQMPTEVEVRTFGCQRVELTRFTRSAPILDGHLGVLNRRAVAEQMRRADVFLDMSMYQAFGRTALEAMASGCTALVPRLGGVWEFVEHEQNALAVDTLDLEASLEALSALVGDRARLRDMQECARSRGARFSIARAALSEYLLFEREHRRRTTGAGQSAPALAATASR